VTRVVLARSARATIEALPFPIGDAVLDALDLLERDPRAGHRLRGRLEGLWSLRVGVYRIVYELRDDVVRVAAIRHRAEAYRSDPR
jgi:mRNA interferase RelE/StbE